MYVVILNWKEGDNDPFTPFNAVIAGYLEARGKRVRILEITDPTWTSQLLDLAFDGIDFVFTWQGIGTEVQLGEKNTSLWESLGVPVISYHGDHPCHMPMRHALDIRNCAHVYATSEFCRYANRHMRRLGRAIVHETPVLSQDLPLGERRGDYFVLAKNLMPTSAMEAGWRTNLPAEALEVYLGATEVIKAAVASEDHPEIHGLLDDYLQELERDRGFAWNHAGNFHLFHSQLDAYTRNLRSARLLDVLHDVPVHIYGRGWSEFAVKGRPHHHFHPGRPLSRSQSLYYSRYGILDVAPSATGTHDRTLRALKNETPFLSSGHLPGLLPDLGRYDGLFFRFNGDDLREKAEAVMADPEEHAERARAFSHAYQLRVHPFDFVAHLDLIARSLDRR